MSRNEILDLWARFLSGSTLSQDEEKNLLEALRGDPDLRAVLLGDKEFDGMLDAVYSVDRDQEAFLADFRDRVHDENNATKFLHGLKTRIEQGRPAGGTPSNGPKATARQRPTVRRRTGALEEGTPQRIVLPAVLAAAVLLGIALLFAFSSSDPTRRGVDQAGSALWEKARKASREQGPAPTHAQKTDFEEEQVRAERIRREAEERLAQVREEEEKAWTARRAAEAAQDKELRQKAKMALAEASRKRMEEEELLARLREEEKKLEENAAPPQRVPAPEEKPARQGTQTVVARIEKAENVFQVLAEGKRLLRNGEDLRGDQVIEVGEKGSATIAYLDKSRLELGAGAEVRDLKVDGGKRLFIRKGNVRAVVTKQPKGEPLVLSSPHGEARVLGTTLRLNVDLDSKKGTLLEVEEGKVELKNVAGKSVLVESGRYAVAAEGLELVSRPAETLRVVDDFEGPLAWQRDVETPWLGIRLVGDAVHGGRSALRFEYRPKATDSESFGQATSPISLRPGDRTLRFYMRVEKQEPGANWNIQFRLRDRTCWMIGDGLLSALKPGWNRIDVPLPREPQLTSDPGGRYDPLQAQELLFSVCNKLAVFTIDDLMLVSGPDTGTSDLKSK
jgi:hypothetical protein